MRRGSANGNHPRTGDAAPGSGARLTGASRNRSGRGNTSRGSGQRNDDDDDGDEKENSDNHRRRDGRRRDRGAVDSGNEAHPVKAAFRSLGRALSVRGAAATTTTTATTTTKSVTAAAKAQRKRLPLAKQLEHFFLHTDSGGTGTAEDDITAGVIRAAADAAEATANAAGATLPNASRHPSSSSTTRRRTHAPNAFPITAAAAATTTSDLNAHLAEQYLPLTGLTLRQLLLDKYGRSYDIQPVRRSISGQALRATYLQVMWRFLEQPSFALTEWEYTEHLEAIAQLLRAHRDAELHFAREVWTARRRPTTGLSLSVRLPMIDASSIDALFRG